MRRLHVLKFGNLPTIVRCHPLSSWSPKGWRISALRFFASLRMTRQWHWILGARLCVPIFQFPPKYMADPPRILAEVCLCRFS